MRLSLPALSRGVAVAAALWITVPLPAQRAAASPAIPGAGHDSLPDRVRAEVLAAELGCAHCHAAPHGLPPREAPDLTGVGGRVDPAWLERFLANPRATHPGTAMPDLHGTASATERTADARAIAAWLRSRGAADFARDPVDTDAVARGQQRFHQLGCVACHAPRDAEAVERPLAGSVPLGDLATKYSLASLREFLLEPHRARPAARMPDFGLGPRDAHDLANFLMQGQDRAATPTTAPDPALVERGALRFTALGCAACHRTADGPAPLAAQPLATARPDQGCLAPPAAPRRPGVPQYDLSTAQRSLLASVVGGETEPLAADARALAHLAARNCLACHARGDHGGIPTDRAAFFTGDDEGLGDAGRVPPPLTGVGAKLQPAWLHRAIAHGQRERDYLHTRMPGFGVRLADELAALLESSDTAAIAATPAGPTPLPDDRDAARAVRELGRTLVGDQGMGCIVCHTFAGERSGAMGAIDLVATTGQRLRPEWFVAYMQDPARFRAGTIMPRYFVDGTSTRPDLAAGDVDAQLAGLWHYLAAGRNQQKPAGLRLPLLELTVADEAVMLRRAVQHTGKRGISVGLPGGVSYTFDAETLAWNQVWWGRFLDVGPVFRGQGSGQAHIPSRERIDLGRGPAFAVLDDPSAPWPDVPRHAREQRLLGYDLDAARRPTFRYTVAGGAEVRDHAVAVPASGRQLVRRTLALTGDGVAPVTFRIAHGPAILALGGDAFRIGERGVVRIAGATATRIGVGDAAELRATLAPPCEVVVEYSWTEVGR